MFFLGTFASLFHLHVFPHAQQAKTLFEQYLRVVFEAADPLEGESSPISLGNRPECRFCQLERGGRRLGEMRFGETLRLPSFTKTLVDKT